MKKYPHKYSQTICTFYGSNPMVTCKYTIFINGMLYYNTISYKDKTEISKFIILRELVKSKHQMIEDINLVHNNLKGY